jgi:putative ABC transport system permease protein
LIAALRELADLSLTIRRERRAARVESPLAPAFDLSHYRRGPTIGGSMRDLRHALHALRATPIVTMAAVVSLALGIGANTAIFSMLDSLLLRSLPVREPGRLVHVLVARGNAGWTNPLWEQIRAHDQELFDGAVAWDMVRFNLSAGGQTNLVDGMYASGSFFGTLGVPAILGRTFAEGDDVDGGGPDGPVAVISYAYWQQQYGGGADVIGRTITLERAPFTIIGVTPPSFLGPTIGQAFQIAIPIGAEAVIRGRESRLDRRDYWWLDVMARLKPGQTIDEAEQAFRGVQPMLRLATPPAGWSAAALLRYLKDPFALEPGAAGTGYLRRQYRRPLEAMMVVVSLVLLIACVNIANLLLARGAARRHEVAIRMALGATRLTVARQWLAESLLLAGAGALAGLMFARWASVLLVRQLSSRPNGVVLDLSFDWRVLGFTAIVAIATAVIFGTVPALRATRIQPNDALKEHGRSVIGAGRQGLGHALVIVQVALSLVLVVAAGLFIETFTSLATRDLGFDRNAVLIVDIDAARSSVSPTGRADLYDRVRQAAVSVPGVASAAVSDVTPVGGSEWNTDVRVPDGIPASLRDAVAYVNALSPDWFRTYGTAIVAGRDFDARDRNGAPSVVIVNETFVRRRLGQASPIGRRLEWGPVDHPQTLEVVGVARDAIYSNVHQVPPPTMYVPEAQQKMVGSSISLSVRAAGMAPALLTRDVAAAVNGVDRDLALTFHPLAAQVDAVLIQERLVAMLSGFFGGLALLLAGLGLYGVMSYAVSQRRTEIGVRLALGADPAGVIRLVLRRVGILVTSGVVLGGALSLWLGRFASTLLYGVKAHDPTTLMGAVAVLVSVAVLASALPAWRVSRIDPTTVLREG